MTGAAEVDRTWWAGVMGETSRAMVGGCGDRDETLMSDILAVVSAVAAI